MSCNNIPTYPRSAQSGPAASVPADVVVDRILSIKTASSTHIDLILAILGNKESYHAQRLKKTIKSLSLSMTWLLTLGNTLLGMDLLTYERTCV